MRDRLFAGLLGVGLVATTTVHAGHPMLSEDTGTQGTGNYELELGYDWGRLDGLHSFLFQPQLSYGASPILDLIVQPSFVRNSGSMDAVNGLGDTNLDAKWRFFGAAPLTLGVRAGLELPTAQDGLGLPPGHLGAHGILVATFDASPWSIDLNAGYGYSTFFPTARSDLYHVSAAAQYTVNEHLLLLVDTSADTDPDPNEPALMGVALTGFIYTLRPGFDLDMGFRRRLNTGAPAQQWLLGITYRGAF